VIYGIWAVSPNRGNPHEIPAYYRCVGSAGCDRFKGQFCGYLDIVLFRKQGRRSVLTPAGRVLLEQGRELLAAAGKLAATVKQVHSGWEPSLGIAVDSVLGFERIYPVIEEFYTIQPDIEINLYEEVLGGTWEAVVTERADLAIGATYQPGYAQGIKHRQLTQAKWVFAVVPGHPLCSEPRPITPQQIEQHRLVVVQDSSQSYAPLNKRLFARRPVLRVPSVAEKIRAQVSGLGVGFVPSKAIESLVQAGKLVVLPVEHTGVAEDEGVLHIAWKSSSRGKALHWFIERIALAFAD
jgi:DNA-binding transcriptional LysR family regulator